MAVSMPTSSHGRGQSSASALKSTSLHTATSCPTTPTPGPSSVLKAMLSVSAEETAAVRTPSAVWMLADVSELVEVEMSDTAGA